MRLIQTLIIFHLISLNVVGQNIDSTSLSFLMAVVNKYSKSDSIFYADGITKNVFDEFKDSLTRPYLRGVNTLSGEREIVKIQLSKEDRLELNSAIRKMAKFVWPDQLFKNSVRIPKDSIFSYHNKRLKIAINKYSDSSKKPKTTVSPYVLIMKLATVYQFMPPIFLKQKSIAVFYYFRFCGGECGDDELAVYKLENGKYNRWLLIHGGVF